MAGGGDDEPEDVDMEDAAATPAQAEALFAALTDFLKSRQGESDVKFSLAAVLDVLRQAPGCADLSAEVIEQVWDGRHSWCHAALGH